MAVLVGGRRLVTARVMTRSVRASNVKLKRAYEPAATEDGLRFLVDRLWPRGVSRGDARLDGWMKQVAPSDALRAWFGHDPRRWQEFRRRYRMELAQHARDVAELRRLARQRPITLVYSAKDEIHNDAVVLRAVLLSRPEP